jgi:hypothetical protein
MSQLKAQGLIIFFTALGLATQSKTGGDEIFVDKYGKAMVWYAQVDKAGDYFRRMFIDRKSAKVFVEEGTLPESATLVLETWFGLQQSTVFVRQWTNSRFD